MRAMVLDEAGKPLLRVSVMKEGCCFICLEEVSLMRVGWGLMVTSE